MTEQKWTPDAMQARQLEDITRLDAKQNQPIPLEEQGSWKKTKYLLDSKAVNALIAAMAAGRPLLVRGEPGVGKSQLARAAAAVLERPFLPEVIQPDSEYTDLLWRVDYTQRLADAQLREQREQNGQTVRVQNLQHYIGPGALWWALNPKGAQDQTNNGCANYRLPQGLNPQHCQERGVVLLIDEVDKADINLTNGLLEVLGNGGFDIPATGENVANVGPAPLVILTSNDTRELPPALLRRCVVLTLSLGDNPEQERATLLSIAEQVYPGLEEDLRSTAAEQILQDRADCRADSRDGAKTGLAEYLDLLQALEKLQQGGQDPAHWLSRLGQYFHKSQVSRHG